MEMAFCGCSDLSFLARSFLTDCYKQKKEGPV